MPALMVQGTSSHAGKSLLVSGLCRAFANEGLEVRPFKPQNMSNNAAVAVDGGEIGRAQALQARAARCPPTTLMNPVLLKPQSGTGAQLIVQGKVQGSIEAARYHFIKSQLLAPVLESFAELAGNADLIIAEGAGSPAEVNLRQGDFANMGFALAAGMPVVLAGDIERGGVIASIVGTYDLLEPPEQALLKGYIINKFRGDPALFRNAHPILEARTKLPPLGVVPWFDGAARLPEEDVLGLGKVRPKAAGQLKIAVPRLPRISNLDDLDPLLAEPDISLLVLEAGMALPGDTDLVLLIGSKATIADLESLRAEGWDIDIRAHHRRGGHILGLCGGLQMLGRIILDPEGIEGSVREAEGLGLLDIETELRGPKTLKLSHGKDLRFDKEISGYQIHLGVTLGGGAVRPMLTLDGQKDGVLSEDGRVGGCYLHGLFANDDFR
ncbi:MAG: cobyric acid synthase, partial [Pseudomonadota bacterium]